jgi:hypothetical protein
MTTRDRHVRKNSGGTAPSSIVVTMRPFGKGNGALRPRTQDSRFLQNCFRLNLSRHCAALRSR